MPPRASFPPLNAARTLALVTLAWALGSCATAPPKPAVAPRWPSAPERSRIAWSASFPDARAAGDKPGFWRHALNLFLGLDETGPGATSLLVRPFGVAATADGVIVADPDGQRVVRVDWRTGAFTPIACTTPWSMPMAVAAAEDGTVFVADGAAGRVVRVTPRGCSEIGADALTRPTGIAVSGGELFVVDPPRHEVVVFDASGAVARRFGTHGEGEGQLNFPTAIAARPDGTLLVVDALNFRVVVFSREGAPVAAFGHAGERDGAFARPKGVAVDAAGRIYVSDAQLGAVLVFDAQGQFELAFAGSGVEPYEFSLPAGVAVAGDKLFVADAYHHRVEMYDILEEAP